MFNNFGDVIFSDFFKHWIASGTNSACEEFLYDLLGEGGRGSLWYLLFKSFLLFVPWP